MRHIIRDWYHTYVVACEKLIMVFHYHLGLTGKTTALNRFFCLQGITSQFIITNMWTYDQHSATTLYFFLKSIIVFMLKSNFYLHRMQTVQYNLVRIWNDLYTHKGTILIGENRPIRYSPWWLSPWLPKYHAATIHEERQITYPSPSERNPSSLNSTILLQHWWHNWQSSWAPHFLLLWGCSLRR